MPPAAQVALDDSAQDDLELLLAGALAPWTGADGQGHGLAVTVPGVGDEPDAGVAPGQTVRLLDAEGAPLAEVRVTGTYPATGGTGIVGPVRGLTGRAPRPFESRYLAPAEVRGRADGPLVVPMEQPLSAPDVRAVTDRAGGGPVLLLALAGAGRPRGVSAAGLIRAGVAAAGLIPHAELVAVPLAGRSDPARDIEIRERVVRAYSPAGSTRFDPGHHGPLPEAVAEAVRLDRRAGTARGVVVLFTGLSGSGKSTIARGLRNALVEAGGRTVTLLDGDVVRRHLSAGLGFSRQDRDTNIRRIGWVAAEIARHGGLAIASPIAPFAATRAAVREMADAAGGEFVLVHVATPLAECERRDRKGLYARARAGEIADFTGISSPYEEPDDADLRIDTTDRSVGQAVDQVMAELLRRGLVDR